MSHTASFTATNAAWVPVFAGAGSVQIQLNETDPMKVHVGESAPASDAAAMILYRGGLEEYVNLSVEADDTVYVRAVGGDSVVTVIGTGSVIA